jgi:hypothetical protein
MRERGIKYLSVGKVDRVATSKRRRAAAIQDAARNPPPPRARSVLECASPLALFKFAFDMRTPVNQEMQTFKTEQSQCLFLPQSAPSKNPRSVANHGLHFPVNPINPVKKTRSSLPYRRGLPASVSMLCGQKQKIPADQTQFQIALNLYFINHLTPVF